MNLKGLSVIILTLCLSACTMYHVDSQDTSATYYPSKYSTKDISYLETINEPHESIGIVTVNAERRQYLSEIIDRMKREAAILGGDAITNIESDATGAWRKLPAQEIIGNAYVRANFRATVVAFR